MKITFSFTEIRHILISAAVLSVAFAIALFDGILNIDTARFPVLVLFAFIAVGVGFLAHELIGHKVVAQRFGLFAEYRMWNFGLAIALLSSFAGFVFAAPGAVYISQRMDLWGKPVPVTKKRMGLVGLMGPVVNVAIALVFLALSYFTLGALFELFAFAASINMWLALFNMLPVPPLDGSKVLAWDRRIFAACFITVAALWYFAVYVWPGFLIQQALI
jgi:Zn-dependent protease